MRHVYIWLDDMRELNVDVHANCYVHAHSYYEAIYFIQEHAHYGDYITIDFDHDLGLDKSGYDVAKWIVEHNIQNLDFLIHSMNPVGRANISQLLTHYGYKFYKKGNQDVC